MLQTFLSGPQSKLAQYHYNVGAAALRLLYRPAEEGLLSCNLSLCLSFLTQLPERYCL